MLSQTRKVTPKRLHVESPINARIEFIPQLDFLGTDLHSVSLKSAPEFRMEDSFVQSV